MSAAQERRSPRRVVHAFLHTSVQSEDKNQAIPSLRGWMSTWAGQAEREEKEDTVGGRRARGFFTIGIAYLRHFTLAIGGGCGDVYARESLFPALACRTHVTANLYHTHSHVACLC